MTRALSLRDSVAEHSSTTRARQTTTRETNRCRWWSLEKGSSENYLG